jgi:hypothetical protein
MKMVLMERYCFLEVFLLVVCYFFFGDGVCKLTCTKIVNLLVVCFFCGWLRVDVLEGNMSN